VTSTSYDALVLAGGRSRRMGGGDKTRLPVDGASLLDRVLLALDPSAGVVVVGDERPTTRSVTWTREQPLHEGPAAAVAAGLALVDAEVTVLLAADLPLLTASYVDRLVASTTDTAGAVPIDAEGMLQWLCSAWPSALLRSVDWAATSSMRHGLGRLPYQCVAGGGDTGAATPWLDCDTPEDLQQARERA
jgi:molybdopterin-guanine dinucleotide biosynthesis protein A